MISGQWLVVSGRGLLASFVLAVSCSLAACGGGQQKAEAPKLAPANPQALGKMVQGVQAAKDSKDRAISLLEEAVKADAGLWEAHYNLGVLLADKGDLGVAERHLATAQQLAPNAEDVAVALSEVRRRRGDKQGAIDALRPFVKENPGASHAPVALIGALREGDKIEEAIVQAQQVLVRHAGDPRALSELALSYLDKGEIDTAELLSQEALKADPKSAIAERTAGLISLNQGDDAVAFRHFAKASELDPKDNTARLNVATVLLEAGIYDKAAAEFRTAFDAEPENSMAALGLAAARRAQGKRDESGPFLEAEKLLKGILDREPHHVEAAYNLAVLYADFLKRPGEAAPLFQRFLDQAPKNHPARADAEKALAAASNQKK
ncbi:MAG TPA: tetratricopeptide repeat protein [Polyangiaceae bacterium]|nr:tetratricopeptide repeat protein [Polyangiaceae bacterium]